MSTPAQKLSGKVALVTGSSKGIGAAIAKALAAEGASVVVNYASSKEGADRVVAEITKQGGKAVAVGGDMSKEADITRLFAETHKAYGKLDILVNNAGVYSPTPIGQITEESFHRHFNINVLGLLLASQEAVKAFGTVGGVIVNVSSIVATYCPPGISVYNATKGAVESITRSFAKELAGTKIRINSVNPGLIATEGTHTLGFVKDGVSTAGTLRVGQPEDIASVVVFLASDDSRWINGEALYASGDLL